MLSDWRSVNLAEVCERKAQYGYTAKAQVDPVGPKFLRTTDLGQGTVRWEQVPHCDIDDSDKAKYLLSRGDLVISRMGTVGLSHMFTSDLDCVFASYLVRFRPDESIADPYFMRYVLLSPSWWDYVERVASGSVQPNLNAKLMSAFEFKLPPLDEQRRIAGVLGALDDLASQCGGLAQSLRSLTRVLFEDRVRKNGVQVGLGEILDLKYGKSLTAASRVAGDVPVISSAGVVGSHNEALVDGPGVVVGRKGSVGTVHWSSRDFFPIDTAFYVETTVPMLTAFLALECAGLDRLNTDSAVPGLNRANALAQRIDFMTTEDALAFSDLATELWEAAEQLEAERESALQTRDELLPLLMSGRVWVGEVDGVGSV